MLVDKKGVYGARSGGRRASPGEFVERAQASATTPLAFDFPSSAGGLPCDPSHWLSSTSAPGHSFHKPFPSFGSISHKLHLFGAGGHGGFRSQAIGGAASKEKLISIIEAGSPRLLQGGRNQTPPKTALQRPSAKPRRPLNGGESSRPSLRQPVLGR